MNSVSLSWSWYYINFANIDKVKITSFNVLYWSLELLYLFGNLINDIDEQEELFFWLWVFSPQIAPNVVLTDEEIEYRMKQEYQAYLDEEAAFLRELGLLKEEDEPLPETWPPGLWHPHPLTDQWPSNKCSVILILYPTREGSAGSILCYMDVIFTLNDDLWCRTVLIIFY